MKITEYLLGAIVAPRHSTQAGQCRVQFAALYSTVDRSGDYTADIAPQKPGNHCAVDITDTALGAPVEWIYWLAEEAEIENSCIRTPSWHREAQR